MSILSLNQASPQRIFVFGGLLLISIGMIFGDIFAAFILHPLLDDIGAAMYQAAQAVSAGDSKEVINQMMSIGGYLESKGTKVDAHSHIINLGFFALLLALVQPKVAYSKQRKRTLAKIYVWSALILPISVFCIHYIGLCFSPFEHIGWASLAADFAGLILICVCFAELFGIFRYLRGKRDEAAEQQAMNEAVNCSHSRNLIKAGVLMLLLSMSFGYYYAGVDLERIRADEGQALAEIVQGANEKNMAVVNQGFANYGQLQLEKGVKVAAHAHLNEFGLMMLLLSFIQPLIFLSEQAKRRTVAALIVAGFGLPLAVLSEMKIGLVGGGIADTFGLVAISCLLIMLYGVARQSAVTDINDQA
jgi:hypothetical protein